MTPPDPPSPPRPEPGPEDLARVRRVAALARLAVGPEEEARLARDFTAVLAHFASLAALDVTGETPMTAPAAEAEHARPDTVTPGLDRERLLEAAPDRRGDFFGVPKTVGEGS